MTLARRTLDGWRLVAVPALSILLALALAAAVIVVSSAFTPGGLDVLLPVRAYSSLAAGAFGSPTAIGNTLVGAAPLVLGGLSVALAFKAGLFNIGVAGQFLAGAFAAAVMGAWAAAAFAPLAVAAALIAGAVAGGVIGFIPGFLKARTGAHEVVTTIMLNNAAALLLTWAVTDLVRAPGFSFPRTGDIGNAALPVLAGRNLHLGILLALIAVPAVAWMLDRTTIGFEIRSVGANPVAARYSGMRPVLVTALTMTLAGVLGGMAGAIQMLGVIGFYAPGITASVGFDSIAVALVGRSDPVGVVLAAVLFGAFRAGAPLMQIETSVPVEVIDIIQALVILFLAADVLVRRVFRIRRARGGLGEPETVTRSWSSPEVATAAAEPR